VAATVASTARAKRRVLSQIARRGRNLRHFRDRAAGSSLAEETRMSKRAPHHRPLVIVAALISVHCGNGPSTEDSTAHEEVSGLLSHGPVHPFASQSLCLDVVGQSTENGTPVQVWACSGSANQQWAYDGTTLRVYGNKCLDVTGGNGADGTRLQIWDCIAGNTNQMWTANGARFAWTGRNRCLDLTNGVAQPGTPIQSWTCYNGDVNQEWSFESTDAGGGAPNPPPPSPPTPPGAAPDFGPNVIIFDPSMPMSAIQSRIDSIYAQQDSAQFGSGRYAYFFKPGQYDLDVKVGFYTQVLGLGASPDDVTIRGAVRAKADWLGNNNATCNFWRGVENLAIVPSQGIDNGVNRWGVSQGTQIRRAHVRGNLALDDGGWSSGGFIADSVIDGEMRSGTQQQFLTRNDDMHWTGSNWNMVFVGDGQPPNGTWPYPPYTVVGNTPVVREKPYLILDATGHYQVIVPALKHESRGHSWSNGAAPGTAVAIDAFYVAKPSDSASTLNAALAQGKHLLLTPGTYHLDRSLAVSRPGTIILGLGLATLAADHGTEAITIADVDGVTVGGVLLEAGATSSPALLEVGPPGSAASHSANPTALFDLYCRIGGAHAGTAQRCVTVNSNNVLIDNTWLWRADHGAGADWNVNRSDNGLVVNGSDVTAYGLFVEHFQGYQTLWNGNGGAVYFYQSEMPYDPPYQGAWQAAPGHNGYPSYKVADGVTRHHAEGLGVYSVFSQNVSAENAIESPAGPSVSLHHMVSVSLASGSIAHIVNGSGGSVGYGTMTAFSGD
jgi:hypothetical protein